MDADFQNKIEELARWVSQEKDGKSFLDWFIANRTWNEKDDEHQAQNAGVLLDLKTKYPDNPLILLELGIFYFQKEDFVQARECFEKSIELFPQSVLSHFYMGLIYEKNEQYLEAFEEYSKVISAFDNESEIKTLLAKNYVCASMEGVLPGQITAPSNKYVVERAQYGIGCIYLRLDNNEYARDLFSVMIKNNPGDYTLYWGLGNAFYGMNLFLQAREQYDKALSLEPDNIDLWFVYGLACECALDTGEAKTAYNRVLLLNNTHADAAKRLSGLNEAQSRDNSGGETIG